MKRSRLRTYKKFGPNSLDYPCLGRRAHHVWVIHSLSLFPRDFDQTTGLLAAEIPLETAWQQRHLPRRGFARQCRLVNNFIAFYNRIPLKVQISASAKPRRKSGGEDNHGGKSSPVCRLVGPIDVILNIAMSDT